MHTWYWAKILLLGLNMAASSVAIAQKRLWPTHVNSGDCLAARIYAPKSQFTRNLERQTCTQRNADNPLSIKQCIEVTGSTEQISFFTDRCSGDEYFISLNSKEHRLKRTSGNAQKSPYFAGTFEGDGLKVVVKSLRLISKTYEKGSKRTEADVEDAAYKVSVTVKHGRRVEEINGVLSYGR
jgi:hypothetical protein